MGIYVGKSIRPYKNKIKNNNNKNNLDSKFKDMDIKGGSAPILIGDENNYLVSKRGGSILNNNIGSKKKPINLLL
jgi:hypothetical protein